MRLLLDLRAAFSSESKDHSQGHKSKATIVIVVSKQFDRVLVEQNHCQGLATVKANYTLSVSCHATLSGATYHRPILTRPVTIDPTSKVPGVEVADGCDNGLRGLRSGDEEVRTSRGGETEDEGKEGGDAIDSSEQEGM